MAQPAHKVQTGEVYCLGNLTMPGLYKIGCTTRSVEKRIDELSRSTGVPARFYAVVVLRTHAPTMVEALVHTKLKSERNNASREFFAFENDTDAAISFIVAVAHSGVYQPVTNRPPLRAVPVEYMPPKPKTAEEKRQAQLRGQEAINSFRALLEGGRDQ